MCGINGYIRFNSDINRDTMYNMVHRMNEKIVHRGPDHEGMYADESCALGMRRLSIIDLESGNQPIWNEDHTKLIVFNGEIYNHREIRDKLTSKGHTFRTNTDTEVILVAYDEYGIGCFDRFDGMFALTIYDTIRKEWILARDRAGEKPLYYYVDDHGFCFGSELKSIVSTGVFEKSIDYNALATYFQLTYIPAPMTIYKGVRKLMPGTVMRVRRIGERDTDSSDIKSNSCLTPDEIHSYGDNAVVEYLNYWQLKPWQYIDRYQDYDYCRRELRRKLFKSVERRMISDVPLGAFLSGGFDSSIIVGIMSELSDQKINTFNIGFKEKEYDESSLAKIVAKKNNTNHTELILDWNEALKDMDHILENIDEPFADSSLIATYAVSKLTKNYVTVALTGDAGDELFAGYEKYLGGYYGNKYNKVPKILRKGVIEPIASYLPSEKTITRKVKKVIGTAQMDELERAIWLMSLGFKQDEIVRLLKSEWDSSGNKRQETDIDKVLDFIRDQYRFAGNIPVFEHENSEESKALQGIDSQTRTQYVDFRNVLEGDMLTKVDRASMLTSLETRVPMLARDVIELAFNLPTKYKIDGRRKKIILKETFHDLLPEELFRAPKHGFGVPIGKWLVEELNPKLRRYSSDSFIKEQGLFDAKYIQLIIEEHMSHKVNRASEIWTFFVFQNWYEREMTEN